MKIKMKDIFYYTLACGIAFNIGIFTAYYKIDQRLWNENINKANDIETRALNYPMQDCYDWQDIEMIIFGEIQE
jgi:hypothetical protein|tara:strand:- start:314 stop:535 length:222 start_codon:yes stop_codon:yes gene_type:complete